MMVTWVRGFIKDIHGTMEFSLDDWSDTNFEGEMDARALWTGEADRDAHLRSADFFDTENHPTITFLGRFTERTGDNEFKATTDLTIRGVTRPVVLDVVYQGQWLTLFWDGEINRGTLTRIGFEARTRINRHDFGVSWQDDLPMGGVVVSNEIRLALDVQAILDEDLEQTGAIRYYRDSEEVPSELQAGTADAACSSRRNSARPSLHRGRSVRSREASQTRTQEATRALHARDRGRRMATLRSAANRSTRPSRAGSSGSARSRTPSAAPS